MLSEADADDCMPLHIAAKRNPDIGRCLIKSGVDITLRNKRGINALHIAASEGSVDFIRMIFNEVENDELLQTLIQARTNDGMTIGHVAVSAGYLNCLNFLVEYGLDPMATSDTGCTLLHTAAREGFLYLVKHLSEMYPDLKYETDKKGMDALFSAAHGKSPDYTKQPLEDLCRWYVIFGKHFPSLYMRKTTKEWMPSILLYMEGVLIV